MKNKQIYTLILMVIFSLFVNQQIFANVFVSIVLLGENNFESTWFVFRTIVRPAGGNWWTI